MDHEQAAADAVEGEAEKGGRVRARTAGALREIIGCYNAVMTAGEVAPLIEDRAKVEIEATAVVPGV